MRTFRAQIVLTFFASLTSLTCGAATAGAEGSAAGKIPDQTIHSLNFATGKTEDLHTLEAGKTNVVIFMSSQCHCSQSHLAHVKALKNEFPNMHFVIVDSNTDETPDEAHAYFAKADLGIPVIQDQKLAIADAFKAYKTPHSFVLDTDGNVLYSGGVTDTNDFERAKHFYLKDALTAIKNNKKPEPAFARALGCEIKR